MADRVKILGEMADILLDMNFGYLIDSIICVSEISLTQKEMIFAHVAQLVEHTHGKRVVTSSILVVGSILPSTSN